MGVTKCGRKALSKKDQIVGDSASEFEDRRTRDQVPKKRWEHYSIRKRDNHTCTLGAQLYGIHTVVALTTAIRWTGLYVETKCLACVKAILLEASVDIVATQR
mmetsp:Transcript_43569/g.59187  ORF Transcript_43569/g.59187 Transcript_43569/m.59187 type:complete len:103 (-) Transcript_43569:98-406(-)|eukprot:scaffold179609_cov29-Tisochrysis_lutea.AAC.1